MKITSKLMLWLTIVVMWSISSVHLYGQSANPLVDNLPANYTICSGGKTTAVSFTGTADQYEWQVISNLGGVTGLPSGVQTGGFGEYVLINNGSSQAIVTIEVTPKLTKGGIDYREVSSSFSITVNPAPFVNGVQDQTICSGAQTNRIRFTGTAERFDYTLAGDPLEGLDNGSVMAGEDFGPFTVVTNSAITSYIVVTVIPVYGGCKGRTTTFRLVVDAGPSITLTSAAGTNNQQVCLNSDIIPIQYKVTGATGVTVSGLTNGLTYTYNEATGNVVVSGSPKDKAGETLSYSIVATSNSTGCALTTVTGNIKINALPTPNISGNKDICIGGTNQLIGNPVGGEWESVNPAVAKVDATSGKVTGVLQGAATVAYVYTDQNGCTAKTSVNFAVIVPPVLNLVNTGTDDQYLCQGTAITPIVYTLETGVAGATVTGLPTGLTFAASGTTLTISGTATQSGIFNYNITIPVQGGSCASATATGQLTVNAPPTLSLTSPANTKSQTVCLYSTIAPIEYTIGGGAKGFTLNGLPGIVIGGFDPIAGKLSIVGAVKELGTFTYTVTTTGHDNTCVAATQSGTITVNPLPTITVRDLDICKGASVDLTTAITIPLGSTAKFFSDAAATIPVTNPNNVSNLTSTKTYYVKATSALACESALWSFNVRVNPLPTLTTSDISICLGTTVDLHAAVTSFNGDLVFYSDAAGTVLIANPNAVSGITSTKTYYVKAVNNTTGCQSALSSFNVVVTLLPSLTLSSAAGSDNQSICEDESIITIRYTLNVATTATVSNLPTGVTYSVSAGVLTITGKPIYPGVYNYTVTTGASGTCPVGQATGTITINPRPDASFNSSKEDINKIHFTDESVIHGGSIVSWQWDFGDGTLGSGKDLYHSYIDGGTYEVTLVVTSDKGCVDSVSKLVYTDPAITVDFTIDNSEQCITGNKFYFTDASIIANDLQVTYLWDFGDEQTSTDKNPIHTYAIPNAYLVRLSVTGLGQTHTELKVVFVDNAPDLTVNDLQICSGTSVDLRNAYEPVLSTSVKFYADAAGTTEITNPVVTGLATTTTYYAKMQYNSTGCASEMKQFRVVVNARPTVNVKPIASCIGSPVNLTSAITSTTGITLRYYRDAAGTDLILYPELVYGVTTSKLFYVKAVNPSAGCESALVSIAVTINALPTIVVENIDICAGTTANLTTAVVESSINTWQFYLDITETTPVLSPESVSGITASTVFYVRAVDSKTGCSSELESFIVEVDPLPVFTVRDITVCAGSSVYLPSAVDKPTQSTAKFYRDAAGTNEITEMFLGGITSTTTLYVKVVYDLTGCKSAIVPFKISVAPLPTINVSPQINVCLGEGADLTSAVLSVSGNTVINYYTNPTGLITVDNPKNVLLDVGTHLFYVRAIDTITECISAIKPIRVQVDSLPSLILHNISICKGTNANLKTAIVYSPVTTLEFYSDASGTVIVPNPESVAGITAPTTFYVRGVDDNNGCKGELRSIVVTINDLPTVSAHDIAICAGTAANLSDAVLILPPNIPLFFYDAAATKPVTNPTAVNGITTATTFYVKMLNIIYGCESELMPFNVLVNKLPAVSVHNIDICDGKSVNLTNALVIPLGSTAKFYTDAAGAQPISNPTSVSGITATKTFYVKLINITTGCTSLLASFNVNVNPLPDILLRNISACTGTTVDLKKAVISTSGDRVEFFLDPLGTTSVSDMVIAGVATTYYAKAINATDLCESLLSSFDVAGMPYPTISLLAGGAASQAVCETDSVLTIKYKIDNAVSVTVNPLPQGMTYVYKAGLLEISGTPVTSGTYKIKAFGLDVSCATSSTEETITVNPKPSAAFLYDVDNTVVEKVTFTDQSIPLGDIVQWEWDFGDGSAHAFGQNQVHTYPNAGSFTATLIVTSNGGCTDTVSDVVYTDPSIKVNFAVNNTIQCLIGNYYEFNDQSTLVGATDTTYFWEFGDGVSSNDRNPVHRYTKRGLFRVKLTVSAGSTSQSRTTVVVVLPPPSVNVENIAACAGSSVDLTTAVTFSPPTSATFYSDAGGTVLIPDPTLVTGLPVGTTTFYVKVLNASNCESELVGFDLIVSALPTLQVVPISVCAGQKVNLTTALSSYTGLRKFYSDAAATKEILSPTVVAGVVSDTIFYVKTVDNIAGCESNLEQIEVLLNTLPTIEVQNIVTCPNTLVDLTTAVTTHTGTSLLFYRDVAASILVANPSAEEPVTDATTYYVKSISNKGCRSDLNSFNVEIDVLPTIAVQNLTACLGVPTNLMEAIIDPSLNGTFTFYMDSDKTEPVVNPVSVMVTTLTTFYVELKDNAGCLSNLALFTVTPTTLPSLSVVPITVCPQTKVDLRTAVTVSLGSKPMFFTDAAGLSPVLTPQSIEVKATTTFYVKAVDNSTACQSALVPFVVTLADRPTVDVRNIHTCGGVNVDLTTAVTQTAGLSFEFYATTGGSVIADPTSVKVPAGASTTYFVKAKNSTNCESLLTAFDVIASQVQVTVVVDLVTCAGNLVDLSDAVSSDLSLNALKFYSDAAGTIPVLNPEAVMATVTTPYYVKSINIANGCESILSRFLLLVNPSPTISLHNISYCEGVNVDLTTAVDLSTGTSNLFYFDSTGEVLVSNPTNVGITTTTTIYAKTIDAVTSCESSLVGFSVVINPLPVIKVRDLDICIGESANFNKAVKASAGSLLSFFTDEAGTTPVTTPEAVNLTDVTTFYVKASFNSTACSSEMLSFSVIPSKTVISLNNKVAVYNGTAQSIDSVYVQFSGHDVGELSWISYQYYNAANQLLSSLPVDAGVYKVIAKFAGNSDYCASSDAAVTLTIEAAPQTITFALLNDVYLDTPPFTLTATASSGLPVSFASLNTNVATLSGNAVTVHKLGTTKIVASQAGNTNYLPAINVIRALRVNKVELTSLKVTPVTASIKVNETIQLSPVFTPANVTDKSVTWQSSDPFVASVDTSGMVIGLKYGVTTITLTSANGLYSATSTIRVHTIDTDKEVNPEQGFSPDGDGINDFFIIDGIEKHRNELYVFDAGGMLHYKVRNYKNDWDATANMGYYKGRKLPAGTYYYVLKLDDLKMMRGFVMIRY